MVQEYAPPRRGDSDHNASGHRGKGGSGGPAQFVVKGGPWEQTMPDTNDTEEFPSMGGSGPGVPASDSQQVNTGNASQTPEGLSGNYSQESKWGSRN